MTAIGIEYHATNALFPMSGLIFQPNAIAIMVFSFPLLPTFTFQPMLIYIIPVIYIFVNVQLRKSLCPKNISAGRTGECHDAFLLSGRLLGHRSAVLGMGGCAADCITVDTLMPVIHLIIASFPFLPIGMDMGNRIGIALNDDLTSVSTIRFHCHVIIPGTLVLKPQSLRGYGLQPVL